MHIQSYILPIAQLTPTTCHLIENQNHPAPSLSTHTRALVLVVSITIRIQMKSGNYYAIHNILIARTPIQSLVHGVRAIREWLAGPNLSVVLVTDNSIWMI